MALENLSPYEIINYFIEKKSKEIPIIDENKKLIQRISRPSFSKQNIIKEIESKSPARIGFAGGGSDFTDYLSLGNEGHLLSCAIELFATCKLKVLSSKKIIIINKNLNHDIQESSFEELQKNNNSNLIIEILKFLSPDFGFHLELQTDFPLGSGLGGSSAVTMSILSAFNELQSKKWTDLELIQISYLCERILFKNSGGWQDQYITASGGLKEIFLNSNHQSIKPVSSDKYILDDLAEHLIITYTNISRDSGAVLNEQRRDLISNKRLLDSIAQSKSLVPKMKKVLESKDLKEFSKLLKNSGEIKRSLYSDNFPIELDEIYNKAIELGASSGKLLGAGAGGHFLFFVDKDKKKSILDELNKLNYPSKEVFISDKGIQNIIK